MALNNMGLGFIFTARDFASAKMQGLERRFTSLDEKVSGGAARMTNAFRQIGVGLAVFTAGAIAVGGGLALANAAGEFEQGLAAVGAAAVAAVALHNAGGLATGYGLGRLLRFSQSECRTLAIEVGMQNSGLGVALASKYFSVLATLPGAVFSVWHNFTGALLAAVWTRSQPRK